MWLYIMYLKIRKKYLKIIFDRESLQRSYKWQSSLTCDTLKFFAGNKHFTLKWMMSKMNDDESWWMKWMMMNLDAWNEPWWIIMNEMNDNEWNEWNEW